MKFVHCPLCGRKLLAGEEGSRVVVKCGNCNKLFAASITSDAVSVRIQAKRDV